MLVPNRHGNGNKYRYGYNGKEKDDDVKGLGIQYDYGFRIYDARISKFLSRDPLAKNFPWYTPYQFAGNKPINSIDLDGLEEALVILDKFDEQGNACFRIMRNADVLNNSNFGALKLVFMDKNGDTNSKLIQKMQKYDATIRQIITNHETSQLHSKEITNDYSLTLSFEGIQKTSAKVFDTDNPKINAGDEDGQRIGFNSGGKSDATTKMKVNVNFKMEVEENLSSGYGGYPNANIYIDGIVKPGFEQLDCIIENMDKSKDLNIEFKIGVDNDLCKNNAEYTKIEAFIKDNYPNATFNNVEGPSLNITIKDQEISPEEKEEYNSK